MGREPKKMNMEYQNHSHASPEYRIYASAPDAEMLTQVFLKTSAHWLVLEASLTASCPSPSVSVCNQAADQMSSISFLGFAVPEFMLLLRASLASSAKLRNKLGW